MRWFLSALGLVLSGPTRSAIRFSKGRMITLVVKEPHHFPTLILEHVHNNTTAPTVRGTPISLPTPDEVAAAQPDPTLAKKSKSLVKRKASTSLAPSRPYVKDIDVSYFFTDLENSLEVNDGASVRVVSAPTLRLGKRLGYPPRLSYVTTSDPSYVGTSSAAHASTSEHGLVWKGILQYLDTFAASLSLFLVVMRRQLDLLDTLAQSALAHDEEYDQIPDDDFASASRGEEIDLTFFLLAHGPYVLPYPFEGGHLTEPSPLDLSNQMNVLTTLLASHGTEMNSRNTTFVSSKASLREKFKHKVQCISKLRSEISTLEEKYGKVGSSVGRC
ncbi:hypothetical protein Tco_0756985 [Tanacetum coccineum]